MIDKGSVPQRLVLVFFGLTASGKSTLAQALSDVHGLPYYNTDRERKLLAGLSPTDRRPDAVGKGIYSGDLTKQTYTMLLKRAAEALAADRGPVILDGSYGKRSDREDVVSMARQQRADVLFVFCTCSEQEVGRRFRLRAEDPAAVSDGRWEIYRYQEKTFERPENNEGGTLLVLDTEKDIADLIEVVESAFRVTSDSS